MTSIEDSSCTDSYGKTDNYVSNKGSSASLIGWVQQLSKKRYPIHLSALESLHLNLYRKAVNCPMHTWHNSSHFW